LKIIFILVSVLVKRKFIIFVLVSISVHENITGLDLILFFVNLLLMAVLFEIVVKLKKKFRVLLK